jgi:hypothetical protein
MRVTWYTVVVVIAFMAAVGYGSSTTEITGFLVTGQAGRQSELTSPVPGALVAVYMADTNLLVDSTYTTDAGRFTLKGPGEKMRLYIVATKDNLSKRLDFSYVPNIAAINLTVAYGESTSRFAKVLAYFGNSFNDTVKVLIGLFVGFGFKYLQDRSQAKKEFDKWVCTIRASRGKLLSAYAELGPIFERYDDASDGEKIKEHYDAIVKKMSMLAEELQSALTATPIENAIYVLYKQRGLDGLLALKDSVKGIQQFTEQADCALKKTPQERDVLMKPFSDLQKMFLLGDA